MNHREKIAELQAQIKQHEQAMQNCRHDFKDPIYDPETTREPYGYKMQAQGSDVWSVPEGYKDVQKDRWSRECKICGKKEYTYDQEPIITGRKPKF